MKANNFFSATISTGTYNTKGYTAKNYKTWAGLLRGLKASFYPYKIEYFEGSIDWTKNGITYKLTIQGNY